MFSKDAPGKLVVIRGNDPMRGAWEHRAFVPVPLGESMPAMTASTMVAVSNARAALDSTARQLPNPTLLRLPTLQREAQSTSALEGTYAPLADVLVADEDEPSTPELVEILNYVRAANHGFNWVRMRAGDLSRGSVGPSCKGSRRAAPHWIPSRGDCVRRRLSSAAARTRPRSRRFRCSRPVSCRPRLAAISKPVFSNSWTGCASTAATRSTRWSPPPMSHYEFEALHPFRATATAASVGS